MVTVRVPPGRAGRLRLRRRLAVAEHGANLLDRKLQALLAEQGVRSAAARESERAWRTSVPAARTWLARGLSAGGRDALRQAVPAEEATAAVHDTVFMGVRYPDRAESGMPTAESAGLGAPSAALISARTAYEEAVRAAVRAAVDLAAERAVDGAVLTTRRQLRALRRHWIPRLREACAHLDFALEQSDFEDSVRRRRAVRTGPSTLLAGRDRPDTGVITAENEGRQAP